MEMSVTLNLTRYEAKILEDQLVGYSERTRFVNFTNHLDAQLIIRNLSLRLREARLESALADQK